LPKLPVNNAFAKGVLHGWEVSGSYLAETGQPITLLNATDANANGSSTADRPAINPAGTSNTPSGFNFVCINGAGGTSVANTTAGCGGAVNVVGYVAANPASKYVQAGLGTNTNIAGRDTIDTPGLNIWNIALLKSTKIGERLNVQFRAETYNTFNHRNYSIGLPSNNGGLDSTTNPNPFDAGLVLVTDANDFLKFHELTGGNRTMQLGLKLIF
jgi:hypothetical protein